MLQYSQLIKRNCVNIIDISKAFMDNNPRASIQCTNVKNAPSLFKKAEDAIEYNFYRFGNAYFIPAISIDIDSHKDKRKVSKVIQEAKLPLPTVVVETTKGLHIHWLLENPIVTSSEKQLYLYGLVADELIKLFGSDKNAMPRRSGRIFRNPIKHPHTILSKTRVNLSDFVHIIPKQAKNTKRTVSTGRGSSKKRPNFSTVVEGERHNTLFDYARHLAYRYGNKEGLFDYVAGKLMIANAELPQSVELEEINSIATSIVRFMRNRYNANNASERTKEFNRKLAKAQQDKKLLELFRNLIATLKFSKRHVSALNNSEGSRLLGTSRQTFKKHKSSILELLDALLEFNGYSYTPTTNYSIGTEPIDFNQLDLKVYRITSPP